MSSHKESKQKPHVISHTVVTEYKKKISHKKKTKKKNYNTWLYYEVSHDQNIYNKKGTYCLFWREVKIIDGQTDWRVHIMKNAVYMHLTRGVISKSNIELNPECWCLFFFYVANSFKMWAIMAYHNFLSFVALRNLFTFYHLSLSLFCFSCTQIWDSLFPLLLLP